MPPRRSLPYQAYVAYMRGRGQAAVLPAGERAPGTLIWLHATDPDTARALVSLADRVSQYRREATMLLTGPATGTATGLARTETPADTPGNVDAFLRHWQPDICLWEGPALRPVLQTETARAGIPACLVNAAPGALFTPAPRWMPDLAPHALQGFDRVFAATRRDAAQFQRLSVPAERCTVTGPLSESVVPPAANIDEQEEMAAALGGRPVWLAAGVWPDELSCVLRAHRRAGRLAQRLLLIVVPQDERAHDTYAEEVRAAGLRLCDWTTGDMPDENTQVLLADDPDSLGLWYRLAPVALIGGTMAPAEGPGQSPFVAASLGSAILHGPHIGAQRASYARLAERHAVRLVRDLDELANSVIQLTAPDKAAAMAHAAWECVTEGADLADAVTDWALDALDRREAG